MTKISRNYFIENDTLWLARNLLGKYIFCQTDSIGLSAGIITETEAYMGITDRASHAFGNRRTQRTETMYGKGGVAYVYLCYGIHHLFNFVTNQQNIPHAILLRGVIPVLGLENIRKRLNKNIPLHLDGPGKLSKALAINTVHNGVELDGNQIWLEDRNILILDEMCSTGPRIGVEYAGEDAKLPWRFLIHDTKTLLAQIG